MYPGIDNLEGHEIFSPAYAKIKKIVILGSSSMESLGCDGSWSTEDKSRSPSRNVSYACTITHQMNLLLQEKGATDWRVFNLARNGSYMSAMLVTYAHLVRLKPEIVIFGDIYPFNVNVTKNAGADYLTSAQYAFAGSVFKNDPEAHTIWTNFITTLKKNGLDKPTEGVAFPVPPPLYIPKDPLTIHDLLEFAAVQGYKTFHPDRPPLPIKYYGWDKKPDPKGDVFENVDPEFAYFQGTSIFTVLQKRHGGSFLYYYSPEFAHRGMYTYSRGFDSIYGRYIVEHGGYYKSLLHEPLAPITETYDGQHQTLAGNQIIAKRLVETLEEEHLLPRK